MHQWDLSYNGNQIGPLDQTQAIAKCQANPDGLCWRQGFAEWLPISRVAELNPRGGPDLPGPPAVGSQTADEIDFTIYGEDMQYVEVELDPGESAVAEAGAMMFKDSVVQLDTVFGDASQSSQAGGFLDKLVGAGKRLLTGFCRPLSRYDHSAQALELSRRTDLPEGQLSLRGEGSSDRHSFPEENPHRPVWWRGIYHAETDWRWPRLLARWRYDS